MKSVSKFYNKYFKSANQGSYFEQKHYRTTKPPPKYKVYLLYWTIGIVCGYGNAVNFSKKVLHNGGLVFIVVYLITVYLIGFPIMSIEMAIGQYTSRSCVKAFNFVPILSGQGYSLFLVALIFGLFASFPLSWSCYYIFAAIISDQKWNFCNEDFNTYNCVSSYFNSNKNNLTQFNFSTIEYYANVMGISETDLYDKVSSFELSLYPHVHLLICQIISIIFILILILSKSEHRYKVVHYTVVFPYFAIFFIIVNLINTPGSPKLIIETLKPQWIFFLKLKTYTEALIQTINSLSLGSGIIITLYSSNYFHDNFFKDAFLVVTFDAIFSLACLFSTTLVLGVIRETTGKILELKSDSYFYFGIITRYLANQPPSIVWVIVISLLSFSSSFITTSGYLNIIIFCICDIFKTKIVTKIQKLSVILVSSFVLALFGVYASSPNGLSFYALIDKSGMIDVIIILLVLFEVVSFSHFVGYDCLKVRIQSMIMYRITDMLVNIISYFIPIILCILALIFIVDLAKSYYKSSNYFKIFLEIILAIIILSPIYIKAIHTWMSTEDKYENIGRREILRRSLYGVRKVTSDLTDPSTTDDTKTASH